MRTALCAHASAADRTLRPPVAAAALSRTQKQGAGKMLLSTAGSSWCADAACKRVSSGQAAWVAAVAAAGGAALGSAILIPLQRRRIARSAECAAVAAESPASDT